MQQLVCNIQTPSRQATINDGLHSYPILTLQRLHDPDRRSHNLQQWQYKC